MEYLSHSPEETERIGEELGRTLHAGSVVAYRGGLGMGKTAFTRGLARGLGCRGRVTSPTFTIVNEYSGDIPLFHFDMYRLGGEDELFDIGWEDYLTRGGVCAVEWSEQVSGALPEDAVWVDIARGDNENHHHGRRGTVKILALETSAKSVSAAVTENGAVLASAYQNRGLTHSVTLMPLIDGMLRTAGLSLDDIGLIAAANGPGSFTGLRIGVSAAKGLAWAKELPCCGVSTLAAMARTAADFQGLIIGAMDARRQQIYHALFRGENGRVLRVTQDCAISLEELASLLRDIPEEKLVVGDGAALCADYLSTAGIPCRMADEHHRMQSAVGVALCAEEMAARGETVTAQQLEPVYLRLSQAERERLSRGLKITLD